MLLTSLIQAALAAPPFEAGPLEPLPVRANDIAIVNGELVIAADEGLYSRTESGWENTGLAGGKSLAVIENRGLIVCGPDGVRSYTLEEEVLTELPCTDVVAVPDGYWIQNDEGVFLVPGDAPIALETPDALGGGPELAHVRGNRLYLGTESRLVFPGVTDVERIQVGDEVEWILAHPERSLLGVLGSSGLESAWPQPASAYAVGVGDLGNDGTRDIVLLSEEGWMALKDTRQPPAPPVPKPSPTTLTPLPPTPPPLVRRRPQVEKVRLLGIKMPKFAGLEPDPDYDALFIGGFGLVLGRPLGPNQISVGFSPAATGGIERGTGRFRYYIGADSAPLYNWVGDAAGIHLAMATAGFTIGSDRLRAGPFASLGLLGAGAGLRAVWTPFESRTGKLTGFEGRLTWFFPNAGHAGLYYVSAFPMGRRGRPANERQPRRSFCRRFSVGLGAAGGFSSTAYSWEFVGREAEYQFSGSPALSLACESGSKHAGWLMGGESAPFFFYRVPTSDQGADRRLLHMGSATLGLFAGGNRLRAGPIITAGIWTLGAGFRAVVAPFKTPGGVYHGLELRAVALYPSSPAGQAMVIYNLAFDPKPRKRRLEEQGQ